uniref:Myosin IXb n=1 Tax=Echeneis naucrates TaxID=173247 RepID=A0A665TFE7_ECHNA
MSTTDGGARVVQIYHSPSQDPPTCCPLQISAGDTVRSVIHNAVVTLGLDSSRSYRLLEVRQRTEEYRLLEAADRPLDRVLLWPPEVQRWHPWNKGYHFILEQQQTNDGGNQDNQDYDDLCNLPTVTEQSILEALRQRFHKYKIYTYASNILIAINPNKFLPVYYNPKYIKMYENQPLGKLSPHIFATADAAFRAMLNRQVNQSIVISGESGSGKTESSSYLIHCLTALSQKTYSYGLERTILGAGPVLEAFGNAKTAENNNSSRFGKFIQLNYLESGTIRGAVIEKYLLEKCRLVSRDKRERNYHVFYYLLLGASKDEQDEFHLLKPQDYLYLKQQDLHVNDEEKFRQEYKRLHQAMEMVGFLASTKKHIFSILSAILHIGNVTFTVAEDTQALEVGPTEVLSTLSDLLKVKKELLLEALTKRRVMTSKAITVSHYTLQEASKVRDSMAKSLYSALFDWIVLHINHAMLNRRNMEESVSCLSIGVLDMFGFENLQTNSFEQLCINYANEKLQYYMNQSIFKLEQEDYVSEGITWQNIDCSDNSGCIQLISEKSTGLFGLLDEECNLPQGTDESLLDKLKQQHQDNSFLVTSPSTQQMFSIQHFAGSVEYHIKDFREKNTEHMRPEVVALLRTSERAFLHHLVASSPAALFRWGVLRATIRIVTVFKHLGRQRAEQCRSLKLSTEPHFQSLSILKISCFVKQYLMNMRSLQHVVGITAHDRTSKSIFHPSSTTRLPTISTQFQASLRKLMEKMEKAEPFFIFCVRSNAEMKEHHFDDELVLQQIRHTGMLQMVHIQKSGYSAKYTFMEFGDKFRMLLPKGSSATPEHITELFERMKLDNSNYQIGKTKVFLKQKEKQLLQETLHKELMHHIIILQRWFRACLIRLHFLQRRDATVIIQVEFIELALALYSPHPYHNSNQNIGRASRNPTIRISRATRAIEWNTSLDREITDTRELRNLDEFLGNQVRRNQCTPQIAYKDLMKGYHNKVNALAAPKKKAEISLVVNLFQSVLDGFIRGEMKRAESEPTKTTKTTKKRRKKDKCLDSPLDHLFSTYQVNILQSCDLCGSYIWAMEKAYMCSACKLICHKKCLNKIITDCSTRPGRVNLPGSLHFGVQVCLLTDKANPVPMVVELLLLHVELNGLYTEGIYRKSGSACRARELHQILETDPEAACLDNYPIHTITGLVKRWLRELPDPLMTFSLYSDFLHAVELPEKAERIRAVYQKVDELPPANYNTLERLIFHLVRVSKEQEHNKMSPNSLAIVFAPCILRSPDADDPFLGIKDVSKTTQCVEILISEQFRRYQVKMQNIQELEYAEALAVNQLKLRRQNTVRGHYKASFNVSMSVPNRTGGIKFPGCLVDLACRLPDMEHEHSDDNLDSSSSMSTESLDDRMRSLDLEGQ